MYLVSISGLFYRLVICYFFPNIHVTEQKGCVCLKKRILRFFLLVQHLVDAFICHLNLPKEFVAISGGKKMKVTAYCSVN